MVRADEETVKQSHKLLDAITKYQENKSRLQSFHRFYEKKHPDIAERLDVEIKKIDGVINNLEFTRKNLLGIGDFSNDYNPKSYNTNLIEKEVKQADSITLDPQTLQLMLDGIEKIIDNTSNSKKSMLMVFAISFIAGILSTLVLQYLNNLNGA